MPSPSPSGLWQKGLERALEVASALAQAPLRQLLIHLELQGYHLYVLLGHLDGAKLLVPVGGVPCFFMFSDDGRPVAREDEERKAAAGDGGGGAEGAARPQLCALAAGWSHACACDCVRLACCHVGQRMQPKRMHEAYQGACMVFFHALDVLPGSGTPPSCRL